MSNLVRNKLYQQYEDLPNTFSFIRPKEFVSGKWGETESWMIKNNYKKEQF